MVYRVVTSPMIDVCEARRCYTLVRPTHTTSYGIPQKIIPRMWRPGYFPRRHAAARAAQVSQAQVIQEQPLLICRFDFVTSRRRNAEISHRLSCSLFMLMFLLETLIGYSGLGWHCQKRMAISSRASAVSYTHLTLPTKRIV